MTGRKELIEALSEARDMPDGEAKIAELERISAHADAADDVRLGFDARIELIDVYDSYSRSWRMLAPFGWCLAAFDRDRSIFSAADAATLRRHHKSTVAALCSTPRIGLAQTVAALDDLERRLRAGGHSPQPTYSLRCRIADHLGDQAAARDWLVRWRLATRDDNSDCAACDAARQAGLLAGWGDWAEAVRAADPVLSGTLRCPEQPEKALAAVLVPYLHLNRFAEAAQAHVRAYRRHRHERDSFAFLAEHLRFCALTGDHERGLRILAEHLGRLDRPYDESSAMEFAAAGALVCRLADEAGAGGRTIHHPAHGDRHGARLAVAALGAELLAVAQDLAGRFDARNGTSHQSGRIAGWLSARPLCAPLVLPSDGFGDDDDAPDDAAPDDAPDTAAPDEAPDTAAPDEAPAAGQPAPGQPDVVAPLSAAAIVAVLDEREDRYVVNENGTIGGRWGRAVIQFERIGERQEILHARVVAERRLRSERLAEAYEFCNAWNHDRLLPKAYVHDNGEGELILAGDVTTDLEHGVTGPQLAVLVNATLATGAAFADAVAALP